MADKKFWSGMLVMVLVFGTAIIGCENGTNAGSSGSTGSVEPNDITYTVAANGTADEETSTQLDFTFSAAVSGLIVENITIIETTGKAEKDPRAFGGILTGSGTSWTLNITNITAGKIRVQIDKAGVERGRKTVLVHKNSATGKDSGEAITLANNVWVEGDLADINDVRWYKFEAEPGANYRVQWKDKNGVGGTNPDNRIYVKVTVWRSDLTKIEDFNKDEQGVWSSAPLPELSGTVYLKVEPNWYNSPGTFAIKFFDATSVGPLDRITIGKADATLNLSVELYWYVYPAKTYDPIESVGYKVYRSDTKDGTYVEISDQENILGEYGNNYGSYTDDDPNLEAGKSYWYRIAGYNSDGVLGDMSEPKESQRLPENVDTSTEITVGGETVFGEMKTPDQVDWYKFEAAPGISYWVEASYEGLSRPTAAINIYGYNSDKTPIGTYTVYLIENLSGTIYLKVVWMDDPRNSLGNYGIRVDVWEPR